MTKLLSEKQKKMCGLSNHYYLKKGKKQKENVSFKRAFQLQKDNASIHEVAWEWFRGLKQGDN